MEESDRNTKPEFRLAASRKKSECKEENEEEVENRACRQKAVPKIELQNSLMYNGKLSDPIHRVCTIAITTQEGSNAIRKWKEKRQD